METCIINCSVYSPPVKYNCFTCGGGIFGFAKNCLDKENQNEQIEQPDVQASSTSYTFLGAVVVSKGQSVTLKNVNQAAGSLEVKYTKETYPGGPTYETSDSSSRCPLGISVCSALRLYVISTAEGYTFKGWYYASSQTTTATSIYVSGNYVPSMPPANSYIAAVFEEPPYTITYNPNGGTPSTTYTQTATAGSSFTTRSSSTYTRTGYDFYHWSESATSSINTSSYYAPNTSYTMPNKDLTLYAKWNPITYTITLEPNGGNLNGSTSSVSYSYNIEGASSSPFGEELLFTLPNIEQEGFTLIGWLAPFAAGSWGSVSMHNAGESLAGKYGNVSLVAQWAANDYTLDINANKDGVYAMDYVGGYQDPEGYATFDMYINGSCVANDVGDFCQPVAYGSSYEIRDIKLNYDKAYEGAFLDGPCTNATSLSGTMPAERLDIFLKLRTKTWNDYAASSFDSGSGTSSSPYIIKTAEQLAKVAKDSESRDYDDRHFRLAANIDLSAHEWYPIGTGKGYYFRGTFNGDLYTISNLKIETFENSNAGLFGILGYSAAYVKNLIMENVIIEKGEVVAAVAGLVDGGGTIQNCIVKNSNLTSTTGVSYAGGVCGFVWNSNITNSQVINTTVSGVHAGGLFGYQGGSGSSTLTNNGCHGNTITGSSGYGALHGGYNNSATMNFAGSYAQGTVNGTVSNVMYGDSSAWGNWTYNANLNGGYPVQKTLFHIGGMSGSEAVYNYLKNNLGFTAA